MRTYLYDDETGEEIPLPTKKAVCWDCRGEGVRALHGLEVTDQCAEDPDFAEDYFAGRYDTLCDGCKGAKVVDVVDEGQLTSQQLKDWHDAQDEEANYQAMCESERRAGC